uniref:Uncharacterized protein n=1 Tax=Heterorhabditis bacteriophora TaxID=37862 RepID=A0A1I7WNT0_HETBA
MQFFWTMKKKDMGEKNRVQDLLKQMGSIKEELDKKNIEIKEIGQKTDEYLKKREQQQSTVNEGKINNLSKEHEKAVRILKVTLIKYYRYYYKCSHFISYNLI